MTGNRSYIPHKVSKKRRKFTRTTTRTGEPFQKPTTSTVMPQPAPPPPEKPSPITGTSTQPIRLINSF